MIYYETDYLAHHGVKGMKWGYRKQRIRKGRVSRRQMRADYRAKNAARVRKYANSKTASTNKKRTYASSAIGLGVGTAAGVGTGLALKKLGAKTTTSAYVGAAAGVGVGYLTKIISRKAMRN